MTQDKESSERSSNGQEEDPVNQEAPVQNAKEPEESREEQDNQDDDQSRKNEEVKQKETERVETEPKENPPNYGKSRFNQEPQPNEIKPVEKESLKIPIQAEKQNTKDSEDSKQVKKLNTNSHHPTNLTIGTQSPTFDKRTTTDTGGFYSSKNLGSEKQRSRMYLSQSNFYGTNSQLSTVTQFQSSSTFRNTIPSISFTKSQRFQNLKVTHSGGAQYDLPSLLKEKTTTFGYGEKRIIPTYLERNAKEFPSPSKYASHVLPGKNKVQRSFGLPFKYYAKTYIPKMTLLEPEACIEIPGVGSYQVSEIIGQEKLKYSMTGKGKVFQDMFPSCSPPCNLYSPIETLVKGSKFSQTTFGFGQKHDFTKSNVVSPGPGAAYIMPSVFDKYKNLKRKLKNIQTE